MMGAMEMSVVRLPSARGCSGTVVWVTLLTLLGRSRVKPRVINAVYPRFHDTGLPKLGPVPGVCHVLCAPSRHVIKRISGGVLCRSGLVWVVRLVRLR